MTISQLVSEILIERPDISNDEIIEIVKDKLNKEPTKASISSMRSRLKKQGIKSERSPQVAANTLIVPKKSEKKESKEEISQRIRERYNTLERMADRIAKRQIPCLIVSGPAGLGKSYTIENALEKEQQVHDENEKNEGMFDKLLSTKKEESTNFSYDILKGSISAVGLYITLYEQRENGVVVLDDCDDVFRDETAINLLKAVLDTSEKRIVSYRKNARWLEENDIPQSFEFKGSIAFCTNIDFETEILKNNKMATHFKALIDRSLYLNLTMRTLEDFLMRLHHVGVEDGLLAEKGLSEKQALEVMGFIEKNAEHFYNLSIRLLIQISYCYNDDNDNWKEDIKATKMRTL